MRCQFTLSSKLESLSCSMPQSKNITILDIMANTISMEFLLTTIKLQVVTTINLLTCFNLKKETNWMLTLVKQVCSHTQNTAKKFGIIFSR